MRERKIHDLSEKHRGVKKVNDWWWALGSFGGSIRKRKNGYYFYPNAISFGRQAWNAIQGPFVNLQEAIRSASHVSTF